MRYLGRPGPAHPDAGPPGLLSARTTAIGMQSFLAANLRLSGAGARAVQGSHQVSVSPGGPPRSLSARLSALSYRRAQARASQQQGAVPAAHGAPAAANLQGQAPAEVPNPIPVPGAAQPQHDQAELAVAAQQGQPADAPPAALLLFGPPHPFAAAIAAASALIAAPILHPEGEQLAKLKPLKLERKFK